LIDSTTVDLNLHDYARAKFRSTKAGIKLHAVYDPHACIPTFFEMGEARAHDAKAVASLPLLASATYVFDRACNNYGGYARLIHVCVAKYGAHMIKQRVLVPRIAIQAHQCKEMSRHTSDPVELELPEHSPIW
jgi:hypothetical protein